MKIGITGHAGKVGQALLRYSWNVDVEPIDCDITDLDAVHAEIKNVSPDVIIHCAALTDVDYCEAHPREAFNVNVRGTGNLVDAFTGTLIYLSTDHVFDGAKYFPYSERHKPNPINEYGATKWGGELVAKYGVSIIKIVRSSKLFDYSSLEYGLASLAKGEELEYTELIRRSFLHVDHFANNIASYVYRLDEMPDLLNISGTMVINYFHFWGTVAHLFGYDTKLIKGRNWELENATPRPFRAGLNVDKAKKLGLYLYDYIDGLKLCKSA